MTKIGDIIIVTTASTGIVTLVTLVGLQPILKNNETKNNKKKINLGIGITSASFLGITLLTSIIDSSINLSKK